MRKGEVVIYTDGACSPNPGYGGWAAILRYRFAHTKTDEVQEKIISGGEVQSTNNRMEITSVLEGLKALNRPCNVTIYTDSIYVKNAIGDWLNGEPIKKRNTTGWIVNWQKYGWRRKEGKLLNDDLWKLLYEELQRHLGITTVHVRGHNGDEYNERCDALAVKAREDLQQTHEASAPKEDHA